MIQKPSMQAASLLPESGKEGANSTWPNEGRLYFECLDMQSMDPILELPMPQHDNNVQVVGP